MGVDYERLAFWEDLAGLSFEGLALREIERKFFSAPEWLDRKRLKAALAALDLDDFPLGLVIDDIVEGVAATIYWSFYDYRKGLVDNARASRELRNLRKALLEWLVKHRDDEEGYLILANNAEKENALWKAAALLGRSKHEKPEGKQEHPKTTFLRHLYELYVDLTATPGLANGRDGPGNRFIRECANLVGIDTPKGLRSLLFRTARKR
jgi:hypothetical protein